MCKVLNMGSINYDYVYAVPHFVRAGETLSAESRRVFHGGKGLNQSIALARAGGSVTHAGKVGRDGDPLIKTLSEAGVDASAVTQSKSTTGHTIIQVDPSGENCILVFPGANKDLDEAFVDNMLSYFNEGGIVLLQNEVSCISYAMKSAKSKGMKIAFNPSPFEQEINNYPLELVDWLILNETEGSSLTGQSGPMDILTTLGKKYPKASVILTLGEAGVLCFCDGEVLRHKSYEVNVVDTTAAGDTFTGYFISSIAADKSMEEALRLASVAASISVSKQGAAASIPLLEEVLKF